MNARARLNMAPPRPRRDPSPDAHRRPRPAPALRVVGKQAPARRARPRLVVVVGIVLMLLAPFALVLVHVELTANQLRLSSLQAKGDAAQVQYEKLRLQVSELQSPARVVADAQQLGMVTPATITYLSPSPGSSVVVAGSAPASAPAGPGVGGWSAAKRVDAGR